MKLFITDVVAILRRLVFGSSDTQETDDNLCLLLFHDSNLSIPRKVSHDIEMMKMFVMVLNRCDQPKVRVILIGLALVVATCSFNQPDVLKSVY